MPGMRRKWLPGDKWRWVIYLVQKVDQGLSGDFDSLRTEFDKLLPQNNIYLNLDLYL
jgi:hypothetical protein